MKEYELLRSEILSDLESGRLYNNLLFTVVTAIIAITMDSSFFLASMIPYIVIISIFTLSNNSNKGICKVATYLYVFLEGSDYNWETRHHSFDIISHRDSNDIFKWRFLAKYYLLSALCSIITIYKLYTDDNSPFDEKSRFIICLIIIAFTMYIFHYFYTNAFNYPDQREKMIETWNSIRDKEIVVNENKKLDANDSSIKYLQVNTEFNFKKLIEMIIIIIEKSSSKEEALKALKNLIESDLE